MGILRSVGKWMGSFLFTTFLVIAVSSISIISFTSYENMKAVFGNFFGQVTGNVDQQTLDALMVSLRQQCQGKESVEMALNADQSVTIPCSKVNEPGAQADDLIYTAVFDGTYYKEYDCDFIGCMRSGDFTILLSAKGNQFFRMLKIVAFAAAGLGAALIIICEETWPKRLKGIGLNMVFVGVSFLVLEFVAPMLSRMIAPGMAQLGSGALDSILEAFFAPMKVYFTCILVAGAVIAAIGFTWRYVEKKNAQKSVAGSKAGQPM